MLGEVSVEQGAAGALSTVTLAAAEGLAAPPAEPGVRESRARRGFAVLAATVAVFGALLVDAREVLLDLERPLERDELAAGDRGVDGSLAGSVLGAALFERDELLPLELDGGLEVKPASGRYSCRITT